MSNVSRTPVFPSSIDDAWPETIKISAARPQPEVDDAPWTTPRQPGPKVEANVEDLQDVVMAEAAKFSKNRRRHGSSAPQPQALGGRVQPNPIGQQPTALPPPPRAAETAGAAFGLRAREGEKGEYPHPGRSPRKSSLAALTGGISAARSGPPPGFGVVAHAESVTLSSSGRPQVANVSPVNQGAWASSQASSQNTRTRDF